MNNQSADVNQEEKKRRRKHLFWWFFGAFSVITVFSILGFSLAQEAPVQPEIRVREEAFTLETGETQFVTVNTSGVDELVYESLDPSVVRFEAGTLIAIAPGITTVRVLNTDKTAFDEINVTVTARPIPVVTVTIGDETFTAEGSVRIVDLAITVPDGQILDGIYLDGAFEIPVDGDLILESITLYAKFIPASKRVELTIFDIDGERTKTIEINQGDALGSIPLETVEGDYFVTSLDTCEAALSDAFTFESDMTLYQLKASDLYCVPLETLTIEGSLKAGSTASAILSPLDANATITWRLDGEIFEEGTSAFIPEGSEGKTITATVEASKPYTGSLSETFTVDEKVITLTLETETGELIDSFTLKAGEPFDETLLPDTPENFQGFFLEGETCTDDPFDLETPITEDLTLIQASFNDEAPCLQLDYIVLSGRPVAGTTLTVDIFPIGANVTISWYTSVNNRTYREIQGESSSTFTVRPEDSGKFIRVYVVSDSTPPVVRYDTIKLDVFGTISAPPFVDPTIPSDPDPLNPVVLNLETADPDVILTLIIDEGYIPVTSIEDFEAIGLNIERVWGANTAFEIFTRGAVTSKYALLSDLDFSGKTYDRGIVPSFRGTFEGFGNTIRNITINTNYFLPVGIFEFVGGNASTLIKNLNVVNVSINSTGNTAVGGLIGSTQIGQKVTVENVKVSQLNMTGRQNAGGLIGFVTYNSGLHVSQVSISGQIQGSSANQGGFGSGGLIGYAAGDVSIHEVANHSSVTGFDFTGGLIGRIENGLLLENSYNSGILKSNSGEGFVGGIIGDAFPTAHLEMNQVIHAGQLEGTFRGGIVGKAFNVQTSQITVTGIYYLTQGGINQSAFPLNAFNATVIDNISIRAIGTFEDDFNIALNPTTTWAISFQGQLSYPWLSFEERPNARLIVKPLIDQGYLPIHTVEDLLNIMNDTDQDLVFAEGSEFQVFNLDGTPLVTSGGLNKKYVLTRDLDLSNLNATQSVILGHFSGELDGAGFRIQNLIIFSSSLNVGLFEVISGATIQNLTLSDFMIQGTQNVGALAGQITASSVILSGINIENLQMTGTAMVGGLVGHINNAQVTLTSIEVSGHIQALQSPLGGVVGQSFNSVITLSSITNRSTLKGSNIVGGLVGYATNNGSISIHQSVQYGSIQATTTGNTMSKIGGLVGGVPNASTAPHITLTESVHAGSIHVTNQSDSLSSEDTNALQIGGLVGRSLTITLSNSFNIGNISYTEDVSVTNAAYYVGGLIGNPRSTTTITNSYTIGLIEKVNINSDGKSTPGAIIGNLHSGVTYAITNIFYNPTLVGNATAAGHNTTALGTPSSLIQMTGFEYHSNAGWGISRDFSDIWSIGNNGAQTYPWLTWLEGPIGNNVFTSLTIKNPEDLAAISDNLGGTYDLTQTLDLSTLGTLTGSVIQGIFYGTFNGNGHTISGLAIDATSLNIGLFSQVSGATITDLTIDNFNITGNGSTGSLIGEVVGNSTTTIKDITITNSAIHSDNSNVGGLIGFVHDTFMIIENIDNYSDVNLIDAKINAGGIVGRIEGSTITATALINAGDITGQRSVAGLFGELHSSTALIDDVVNKGNVTASKDSNNDSDAAGIIGNIWNASNIILRNAFNEGTIYGTGRGVAGLVGRIGGSATHQLSIENSINDGAIELNGAHPGLGGVIGIVISNSNITLSAVANHGLISGAAASGVGGLLGSLEQGTFSAINTYNQGSVEGDTNTGGLIGNIASTAQNIILETSYNIGLITGNALVGSAGDGVIISSGAYYLASNTTPWAGTEPTGSVTAVAISASQFTDKDTFTGWDISINRNENNRWVMDAVQPRLFFEDFELVPLDARTLNSATLIEQGYIPISSIEEFQAISMITTRAFGVGTPFEGTFTSSFTSKYFLTNDIDFSSFTNQSFVATNILGTLDGNNYVIRNLTLVKNTDMRVFSGLFLQSQGATIKNLTLENVHVAGGARVGALMAAAFSDLTLENLTFKNVNVEGTDMAGGIVGFASGGSLKMSNILFVGNVSSTGRFAGGLVGEYNSTFNNRFNEIKDVQAFVSVTGRLIAGGLFGQATVIDLNLTDVVVAGQVNATDANGTSSFGGLVGLMTQNGGSGSLFMNRVASRVNLNIQSIQTTNSFTHRVGGFVGLLVNKSISATDSYYEGTIQVSSNRQDNIFEAGFLTGAQNIFRAPGPIRRTLERVYLNGTFIAPQTNSIFNAHLVGSIDVGTYMGPTTIVNSFVNNKEYPMVATGPVLTALPVTKSAVDLQTQATYENWNFNTVWQIKPDIKDGTPYLIFEKDLGFTGPIPIVNLSDLLAIGSNLVHVFASGTPNERVAIGTLSDSYILLNHIDLTSQTPYSHSLIQGTFTGSLEGQDFTLSGLTIDNPSLNNIGLFEALSGASITNLTLADFDITGNENVGILTARILGGDVIIDSLQLLNPTLHGSSAVGGLVGPVNRVGHLTLSSILSSGSSITVEENAYGAGGFIAYLENYTQVTIENSTHQGLIRGDTLGAAGGLIGWTLGSTESSQRSLHIINTHNKGNIQGSYETGGLLGAAFNGNNTLSILISGSSQSANIDPVSGSVKVNYFQELGGLIGTGWDINLIIHNTTQSGAVAGADYTGGFVGFLEQSNITISSVTQSGPVSGGDWVGGLIGFSRVSIVSDFTINILNSHNQGAITGENNVGGLIGQSSRTHVEVLQSSNSGSVSGTNQVGGFMGDIFGSSDHIPTANVDLFSNYGPITGIDSVGGLLGRIWRAHLDIVQSSNQGNVSGEFEVGGILGRNDYNSDVPVNMTLSSIFNAGNVTASRNSNAIAGGFIGRIGIHPITILNSYNSGQVTAISTGNDRADASGFIGYMAASNSNLTIENSYTSGVVTGSTLGTIRVGAFIGRLRTGHTITDSYYLEGSVLNGFGEGTSNLQTHQRSLTELISPSSASFNNWDIAQHPTASSIWSSGFNGLNSFPWLSWELDPEFDTYYVATPQNLIALSDNLDANIVLAGTIDFSSIPQVTQSIIQGTFTGSLDGNNHAITNLSLAATTANQGLFSQLGSGATIQNLTLSGFNVLGSTETANQFGLLAGNIFNATNVMISNILVTDSTIEARDNVGGLIGQIDDSHVQISDITLKLELKSNQFHAGGVVGFIRDTSQVLINKIVQRGSISSTNNHAGGIVGLIAAGSNTSSITTLSSIAQHADVSSGGDDSGGLIGQVRLNGNVYIENAYNTGTIINSSSDVAGGLIGRVGRSNNNEPGYAEIMNSYNVGTITANTSGGAIGQINTTSVVTLSGVYYLDSLANGISIGAIDSSATVSGDATAKTSSELQNQVTFVDYNFTTIWTINLSNNNGYPYLLFED